MRENPKTKRLLSLLLTLVMVVAMLPVNADAAEILVENPDEGWMLYDDGLLTISGIDTLTEEMGFVEYYDTVTKIVIQSGTTIIDKQTFADFINVTAVTLPDTLEEIGQRAFSGCGSLSEICIPASVIAIGRYAFQDAGLTKITFEGDAPEIKSNSFNAVTATAYYPADNETWTEDLRASYGGTLTWEAVSSEDPNILDSGTESDGIQWTLAKDGTLTISGSGELNSSSYYGYDKYASAVAKIVVNPGITKLTSHAFDGYASVTVVSLPGTVQIIDSNAFASCTSLPSIALPEGLQTISGGVFNGCSSLTSVHFPSTLKAINGAYTFWSCPNLTEVHITDLAAWASVNIATFVSSPLYGGGNLYINGELAKNIVIPDSVTAIGKHVFYGNNQLESVVIPSSVTSIGEGAFANCAALKSVTLSEGLTSIGESAFAGCEALTKIDLPQSLTEVGASAFSATTTLKEITIPASITFIGDETFSKSGLNKVTFTGDAPLIAANAFAEVTADAYYPGDNATWTEAKRQNYGGNLTWRKIGEEPDVEDPNILDSGTESDGVQWTLTKDGTLTISGSDILYPVEYYGYQEYSSVVKKIVINPGITGIANDAFPAFTSVTEVSIPGTVDKVYEYALDGCRSLTSVVFPEGLTEIGEYAFRDCASLSSVHFPSTLTEIGEHAFMDCAKLTEVHISDLAAWCAVTLDGYTANPLSPYFSYDERQGTCGLYINGKLVTNLVIPDSVTAISDNAFHGYALLESVVIPASVTSIGNHAFSYCSSLNSVTLPNSLVSIGDAAFADCESLTEINLPESLTKIGSQTFSATTALKEITIPAKIAMIGDQSFSASGLSKVTFTGDAPLIASSTFADVTADAYYPGDNATWTEEVRQNYGGNLTWRKIGEEPEDPNVQDSGTESDGIQWTLTKDGTLTISGSGELKYSSFYGYDKYASVVTKIVVNPGITELDSTAFKGYSSVTEVSLPGTVQHIDYHAFAGCTSLPSIVLPEGLQSLSSIHGSVFENCTNLTSIHFPSTLESIGGFHEFWGCTNLAEVHITDLAAWASVNINNFTASPFYNGASLYINGELAKNIVIPDPATTIGCFAFYGNSHLESVVIPSSVTAISEGAFSGCTALKSVTLSEGLTSIGDSAFAESEMLTNINLPQSLTEIGISAFAKTTALKEITIPANIAIVGDSTFSESGLNKVTFLGDAPLIAATAFTNVTANAYYPGDNATWTEAKRQNYGGNLTWYEIGTGPADPETPATSGTCGESLTWSFDEATGTLTISGTGAMEDYIIDTETTYTRPWNDFADKIKTVEVQPGVTSIGSGAFCVGCTSLTEVILPDTVTTISFMAFAFCPNLESFTFPEGITTIDASVLMDSNVTNIVFLGDAPHIDSVAFTGVTAECTFPAENETWTEEVRQNYGGSLTWQIYCDGEHTYSEEGTVFTAATCTTEGVMHYLCLNCDAFREEPIPVDTENGHAYREFVQEATCTAKGYTLYACDYCDDSYTTLIPIAPHNWSEWSVVIPASYTHTGVKQRTCSECSKLEETIIPTVPQGSAFVDVSEGTYYYNAVLWAHRQGITAGTSENEFSPNMVCSRSQIVTFLWRAMSGQAVGNATSPFTDITASDYYYDAVLWAAKNGITTGTSETTFSPLAPCTRAQVVTFLWRASGYPEAIGTGTAFVDISADAYYTAAVQWAAETGITTGTSATTFSPDATCTRAEIVTFLYRWIGGGNEPVIDPSDKPSVDDPTADSGTEDSTQATFQEMVLVDDENCTFKIVGIDPNGDDFYGYTLKVYLENKTDTELMFALDDVSVNGYMCDPFWAITVSHGKKKNDAIFFLKASFEENGIEDVQEIVFTLSIYDNNDWDTEKLVNKEFTIKH